MLLLDLRAQSNVQGNEEITCQLILRERASLSGHTDTERDSRTLILYFLNVAGGDLLEDKVCCDPGSIYRSIS